MNSILELKGQLHSEPNVSSFSPPNIPKNESIELSHLYNLLNQLFKVYDFWKNNDFIGGALISVHYTRIIAKSNRIKKILVSCEKNDAIRGAKFLEKNSEQVHVFTYFIELENLKKSADLLHEIYVLFLEKNFSKITHDDIDNFRNQKIKTVNVANANLIQILVDSYFVESFEIDNFEKDSFADANIVSIYRTDLKIKNILNSLNIDIIDANILNDYTAVLNKQEFEKLLEKFPFLVSMSANDSQSIKELKLENLTDSNLKIPDPNNEPIIGVIDTQFNSNVYFNK